MRTLELRRRSRSFGVGSFRNLQVAVGLAVVGVVAAIVLMVVTFCVTMVALMKEKREHTQEAELGVDVDSHRPLHFLSPAKETEGQTLNRGRVKNHTTRLLQMVLQQCYQWVSYGPV